MKKVILSLIISAIFSVFSCVDNRNAHYLKKLSENFDRAGENKSELIKAIQEASSDQKEAIYFLIANMPEKDLKELSSEFLLENTALAFKAKDQFLWCANLPDSIFLNEVLPYANLDEKRDNWRKKFYDIFGNRVKNCQNIYSAIDSINKNIRDILEVDYNTKRSIVNISPLQAMDEKMATCTGLSILLVDAFRSVGIPARVAGTPLWTNLRGNHNWVEVWIDGIWYFTEYYPDKLNKSWFLADAGRANPAKPIHWIYAASFKAAETHFPLVWDSTSTDIHAFNVTDRYIQLYQEELLNNAVNEDEIILDVALYESKENEADGNTRLNAKVEVLFGEKQVDFGYTPGARDDLNKFLKFKLKKGQTYMIKYRVNGIEKEVKFVAPKENAEVLKLYLEE